MGDPSPAVDIDEADDMDVMDPAACAGRSSDAIADGSAGSVESTS
eukprot:SAG11_NODE_186_length_13142_cov_17.515679_13_plen_45_part_00